MTQSATILQNADDYIDTTVIFGEVKKTIFSKDFKGGNICNFFGCTKLDFTNADLTGLVILNISQAFGELKLIVPKNWRVETDISQFCATVDDKRIDMSQTRGSNKVLVVTGLSTFAELKIKNTV
jgi:predicted membrane protein